MGLLLILYPVEVYSDHFGSIPIIEEKEFVMRRLHKNSDGTYRALPSDINHVVVEARQIAQHMTANAGVSPSYVVVFEANGVTVRIGPDSDLALIMRDWDRALAGYLGSDPIIGPHPKAKLSEEELANDAKIEVANQAHRNKGSIRSRINAEAQHKRVTDRMKNAPAMEFSNEEAWHNARADFEDRPYGVSILTYAERWARLMQLELSEGKELEEAWDRTSHEANFEGVLASAQTAATHLLALCWVKGAELQRLHNAFWGSGSTEGTVDPTAMLGVRQKDD